MIDAHPYLTRFGTFLSPDEMNQDPLFAFNDSLPDVSAVHSAIVRTVCGDSEYLACNAPLRLELADGRMAWLRQGLHGTKCAALPVSATLSSFPAAEVVWKRGTVGEGTRQIDNVAAIQTALLAHNAAVL